LARHRHRLRSNYNKPGFIFAEVLVAILVSATLLLGAFALLTNGKILLDSLQGRNADRAGLEAGLAALRTDLAMIIKEGAFDLQINGAENEQSLEFGFVRELINPVDTLPMLAAIRWQIGPNGMVRSISTNAKNGAASLNFVKKPVIASFSHLKADVIKLDLQFANEVQLKTHATTFLMVPSSVNLGH
jgi:hypothetical protein